MTVRSGWKLAAIGLGGIGLGFGAGMMLAVRDVGNLLDELEASRHDLMVAFRNLEARRDLDALEALRAGDHAKLANQLEEQLAHQVAALEQEPARSKPHVAKLLRDVADYRERHPWQAPAPDPSSRAGPFASARMLPVYGDDVMVGIQVSRIAPGSAWEQIGVREGDQIVEVDGRAIDSPEATPRLLDALENRAGWTVLRIDETRIRIVRARP
jgi:type II secretory pathway component PulC